MKGKILSLLFIVFMVMMLPQKNVSATELTQSTATEIQTLIDEYKLISDYTSADAYYWISKVSAFNEKYNNNLYYKEISYNCTEAGRHITGINSFNSSEKIIAYFLALKDQCLSTNNYFISDLISEYNQLNSLVRSDAYYWILKVSYVNEQYLKSSVYSDVSYNCVEAFRHSTGINSFNSSTKILADLMILENEIPVSTTLSELTASITKDTYKEGEIFNPSYITVHAKYINLYKNGSSVEEAHNITSYTTDKDNVVLSANDTIITVFVKEGDIEKTLIVPITVESYIVSTDLVEIYIASLPIKTEYIEGEKFSAEGLQINAKYINHWSNGYEENLEKENVAFISNTTSPLQLSDTLWTVSYVDGLVKKEVYVPIIVKPIPTPVVVTTPIPMITVTPTEAPETVTPVETTSVYTTSVPTVTPNPNYYDTTTILQTKSIYDDIDYWEYIPKKYQSLLEQAKKDNTYTDKEWQLLVDYLGEQSDLEELRGDGEFWWDEGLLFEDKNSTSFIPTYLTIKELPLDTWVNIMRNFDEGDDAEIEADDETIYLLYDFYHRYVNPKVEKKETQNVISEDEIEQEDEFEFEDDEIETPVLSKIVKKSATKISIKYSKSDDAKYEIQISTKKKFNKNTKTYTTPKIKASFSKLKKKTYYVRVRAYKILDGKTVYSDWSNTQKIKL